MEGLLILQLQVMNRFKLSCEYKGLIERENEPQSNTTMHFERPSFEQFHHWTSIFF
jgi:hypothetical protein